MIDTVGQWYRMPSTAFINQGPFLLINRVTFFGLVEAYSLDSAYGVGLISGKAEYHHINPMKKYSATPPCA